MLEAYDIDFETRVADAAAVMPQWNGKTFTDIFGVTDFPRHGGSPGDGSLPARRGHAGHASAGVGMTGARGAGTSTSNRLS